MNSNHFMLTEQVTQSSEAATWQGNVHEGLCHGMERILSTRNLFTRYDMANLVFFKSAAFELESSSDTNGKDKKHRECVAKPAQMPR